MRDTKRNMNKQRGIFPLIPIAVALNIQSSVFNIYVYTHMYRSLPAYEQVKQFSRKSSAGKKLTMSKEVQVSLQ